MKNRNIPAIVFGILIFVLMALAVILFFTYREAPSDTTPISYPDTTVVSYTAPVIDPVPTPEPEPVVRAPDPDPANVKMLYSPVENFYLASLNPDPLFKATPEDKETVAEVEAINKFYIALHNKDFDTAFTLGAQGRTLDEIKNLYSEFRGVGAIILNKSAAHKYVLQVALVNEKLEYSFYDVTVTMAVVKSKPVIKSSTSAKIEESLTLDCTLRLFDQDFCLVKGSSGRQFYFNAGYGIAPGPYAKKGLLIDGKQYLVSNFGDGLGAARVVFAVENNVLKLVDNLQFLSPAASLDPAKIPSECTSALFESFACYKTGGALEKYRNEQWFKDNVRYFESFGRYE